MEINRRAKQISTEEAKEKLARSCSIQEVCESQASQKLAKWGIEPKDASEIMQYLTANRFIDNERFAKAFVRDKYKFNNWGPTKIEAALRMKKIDKEIIKSALIEIEEAEIPSSMIKDLEKKLRTVKAKNEYERKMKTIAYGVRKGFGFNEIANAINIIIESNDTEGR